MGKRIISQARGKGSLSYQAKKRAFMHKIKYPIEEGEAEIIDILHSAGHSAPLMKLKTSTEIFHNPAFNGAFVGQKILISPETPKEGDIAAVKSILSGTRIYNIERHPGDGGKMMRAAGTSALLFKDLGYNKFSVIMPNKKQVILSGDCRATLGIIAGDGRILKPFITAGRKFHKMKATNRLWPRTSAIKVNAIDHPFGSGRGKRAKQKIAKRNAPPGRRVGHQHPRRTGTKR
nr:50S ribosomal protein L2P [uncultured archaeon]